MEAWTEQKNYHINEVLYFKAQISSGETTAARLAETAFVPVFT